MNKAKWRTIPGFTKVGILGKSYGTSGELRLRVDAGHEEDVIKAQFLFVDIHGSKVPFAIESMRAAKDVLITFSNVDDRDDAVHISGNEIYLPEDEIESRFIPTTDFRFGHYVGHTIIDNESSNEVGKIQSIREFPQQEMAIVVRGGQEIMIPLHEDLIISADDEEGILVMDLPEGLVEL